MDHFRPHHTFPLLVATTMTLGALTPLVNPAAAIRSFGLPDRIALSQPAQACFTLYGVRASAFGAAIWMFWLKGQFAAVDIMMLLQGYAGMVDGWVCCREGWTGKGVFGVGVRLVVGIWGLLGLTARGAKE